MVLPQEDIQPELAPGEALTVAPKVKKPKKSPAITAALVGEVIQALSAKRFQIPGIGEITEITFLDPTQAAELGVTIEEGFQIKLIPGDTRGSFTTSIIDPQGWEITQDDRFISPEGQIFTRAEIDALFAEPVPEFAPTAPTVEELIASGMPVEQAMREGAGSIGQQLAPLVAAEQAIAEVGILIDEWQERILIGGEYFKVIAEIQETFPSISDDNVKLLLGQLSGEARELAQEIWGEEFRAVVAQFDFSKTKEGFFTALLQKGRNADTEKLLNLLYPEITEHQMRNIFGEALILPIEEWAKGRNENLFPSIIKVIAKEITPENINEDWVQKEYANYVKAVKASPDWQRKLTTGFGNLLSSIGSGANWLGIDGVAEVLTNVAAESLALKTADLEPDKFNWDDIYTGLLENLPTQMALMGISVISFIGTSGLATPVIGTFGAYILASLSSATISRSFESALEAGGTYDAYLALHPEDVAGAKKAADEVFRNNLALAGVDFLQIATVFAPGGTRVVNNAVARGFLNIARNPLGKIITVSLSEAGEEFVQEYWQRKALGQEIVLDDEMKLVVILGAIMGAGFATGGVIYQNFQNRVTENLTPDLRTQFDTDKQAALDRGLTEEQAIEEALNKIAETAEGKKVIDDVLAIENIDALEQAITPGTDAEVLAKEQTFKKLREQAPKIKDVEATIPKPPTPEEFAEVTRTEVQPVSEATQLSNQVDEVNGQIEGLEDTIRSSKLQPLLKTWKRIRRRTDQPSDLTIKEFRDITGKETPPPTSLTKDKKHVILSDALDSVLTEFGYETTDALLVDLEKLAKMDAQLQNLYGERATLKEEVRATEEEVIVSPEAEVQSQITTLQKLDEKWKAKLATQDATKKALVDFVKKNMPLNIRGKMITQVKNVKTDAQLQKAINLAKKFIEQNAQRVLKVQIKKELKTATPKILKGILKGKYTADVQLRIDIIKHNLLLDRDGVRAKIADNITAFDTGEMAYEEMIENNELLEMGGINGMSAEELQVVLDYIKFLKQFGRASRDEIRQQDKERVDTIKSDVIDVVTGGQGLKPGVGTVPSAELEVTKGVLEKVVNWQFSLTTLIDKLSKFHKSKPFQSPFSKFVDDTVLKARNAESVGRSQTTNQVRRNLNRIFGTTRNRQINHILNELKETKINLGTFKNLDGVEVSLNLTKDQIISKYHQLQDPTLEATFTEGMRWTDEIKTAVTNSLSKQERAWADYQMEFYQGYYPSIDAVFSDIYGVHLPQNFFYTPIRRDMEAIVPENVLTYKDGSRYASVLNGSLKSRVANKIPLKFNDSTDMLINHIQQMEHFKAWARPMRDLRRVLGDKDVRTAIRQYHGVPIIKTVDGYLNDIARGGVEKASTNRVLDTLRRNFTRAILGFKPAIALKQIPSVIAYATEMPIGDFFSGVADFWTSPVSHVKFLTSQSAFLRERFGTGHERDVHLALQKSTTRTLSGKGNLTDWFMALIRLGDAFAVSQGSWAKYRSEIRQGRTQEEAILAAEQTTRRTQPTFNLESLSSLQKGNSLLKLLTMFQNQPGQYFRILTSNARNFQHGRGSRAKALSNILLVWVLAPAMFQFIADAFQWKQEHQLRAWVLGPVNYVLIFSQLAHSIYGWVTDEPYDFQASPVLQSFRDIQTAVQKTLKVVGQGQDPYKNISVDDLVAAIEFFAKAGGQLLGFPTPWLVQVERGIRAGEPKELIFSRWSLRPPNQSDHQKAQDSIDNLGRNILDIELASDDVDTRLKAEKELRDRLGREGQGLEVEPLEVFDLKDLERELRRIYSSTLPSDIIAGPDAPPEVKAWAEMEIARNQADLLPDVPLYKIIDNIDSLEDLDQLILQWNAREGIDNLADLKEFDSLYPNANLGNLTRRQQELLRNYFRSKDRELFLEDNPELKINPRDEWLRNNSRENGLLALWGKANILSTEAYDEFITLRDDLDIPDGAIPELILPPRSSLQTHFDYLESGPIFGWNSWETQLLLAKDPAYSEWRGLEPIDTPIASLELKVKNRTLFDLFDSYNDKDSPNYIDDKEERADAKEQLRLDNPEWVDDIRRIEAIEHLADDEIIEEWVERGRIVDKFTAGSSEVKVWLVDHDKTFKWALEQGLLADDGKDWNIGVLRINAEWREWDDAYDAIQFDDDKKQREEREKFLLAYPEYARARRRRDAWSKGFPEFLIEDYVNYYMLTTTEAQNQFLLDHTLFYQMALDLLGWKPRKGITEGAGIPISGTLAEKFK